MGSRDLKKENKQAFGTATRSEMVARYDLIPPEGLEALALRYGKGAPVHGEGNWKHGDKQFVKQIYNHLQKHIQDELSGEPQEETLENAGAIMWAGAAIAWYSENQLQIYDEAMLELFNGLAE